MQVLNLVFYVGSNSYILANPCDWFAALPTAFAFLRDTCFNTTLALLQVIAVCTQPWLDSKGVLVITYFYHAINWLRIALSRNYLCAPNNYHIIKFFDQYFLDN